MSAGIYTVPTPKNEAVISYAPGSAARKTLQAELKRQEMEVVEIPCVIGGKRLFTGNTMDVVMPCDHQHVLAKVHCASPAQMGEAVDAAESARRDWAGLPWEQRVSIFLKAAELLAGPWRDRVNAATMLGQGKTCHQAEVDAACELIDFWRFNAKYTEAIYGDQPPVAGGPIWNRLDHRPLDGFVLAISPFNFTSIGLNLPTAPALLGNTTVWKPATTSVLSCWTLFELLEEAGLPGGVVNLVNGAGRDIGAQVLPRPELGGIHFTGSTATFQHMWKVVGEGIANYNQYPRIVGETGGKDFILAHPSADAASVATAILRGSFEYQGQKCSASSRVYVPRNLWPEVRDMVCAGMSEMKQGDVRDFSNFVAAVIDDRAFKKHSEYLALAKETATVHAGGHAHGETGYFIEPTFVETTDPMHRMMQEEIFGPIVTTYVYEENQWSDILPIVDKTSPYALTGAIFSKDRYAINEALEALRFAAGNFYINDKPTGAVVGQQPFGGGRASGTNDKAGSILNLLRWTNQRTIKETFVPATHWSYPWVG